MMLPILVVATFLGISFASQEDIYRDFKDIIFARGYALEEHSVLTEDGYILGLMRIPGKFGNHKKVAGPPVLLIAGIVDSSDSWVLNDEQSPAFLLAKAGYDVWLGNNRGNKYSRRHINLNTESEAYWDFSWEEAGQNDLPALTDFILASTGYQKLAYIAHSMGTTAAFYALV